PADTQLSSGDAPNDAPKSANKDALQARQVPEGNYRNIFENAAEGIYRSSLDGRQLRANPALVALNGYKTEEEMLAAVGDIGTEWYVEPGRRLEFRRLLDEHGRVSDFESEVYRHKSRERIWISENAWLVRDEKGRALYYEGTVRDITQRKRQEERIRRLAEFHIGLMGFVAETLQRGLDEGFYQRLLARAVEVIPGAQAGSILLKNDEGRYRFVAAQNFDLPALKELRLEERELLGGKKSRRPVIVPDLRSYGAKVLNPERAAFLARSGRLEEIRATLAAPVFLEDELMAVLNLDTFTMPEAFDALAVEMAEAFAVQVGALLKRLSLERQLQRLAEFRQGLVELIAESLQRGPDQSFYQRLLTRAVEVIPGAEAGSLVLLDEGRYRYVAAVNYDLEALQEVVFYDHEVTARQQGPQLVVDFSMNDALDESRRAVLLGAGRIADIKVSLVIPIKLEAQVVAFLHLDNFSNREAFDREAVAMAEALATQVAVLLKRLSLEAELHARQRALEHLANYDSLTGLPNRALFYKELDEALKESKRSGKTVGLLYLDLDGFKFVNDSLGHSSGDSLLQAVALRLTASLRKKDMVSRLGGDEFIMILSRLRQPQDAAFVAQKILDSLAQPFLLAGHKLTVSASIGIASYPDDAQEAEALIHCADTAMYRAKQLGKNTYGFFTPAINALAFQRLTLEGELRKAIEERLFSLDYQPRVDLVSGRIVCFEALLRWRHPERGDIPPA
ncbi:MAG: diguanylate cyclase, partial [Deinococcota bacterium]|nr:diguanylate cyclase [Deinococcota bacterium]